MISIEKFKFCHSRIETSRALIVGVSLDQEEISRFKSWCHSGEFMLVNCSVNIDVRYHLSDGNKVTESLIVHSDGHIELEGVFDSLMSVGDDFELTQIDTLFCYSSIVDACKNL